MGTRIPQPKPDRGEAPEVSAQAESDEAPATSRTVLSHISSL
ncbi:hypothetical protein AB0B01_11910 [Streptomyces sp. NPDC044571]